MSKKKSGSTTMTLKDFHGGSIPSDLPLPSAPGLPARLPDRPSPWAPPPAGSGSGMSASAAGIRNPRPGSAGGGPHRGPSDPPFLSVVIGRHFDEDERKPFDAPAAPPRRPLSDPAPRPAPFVSRSDPAPRPLSSPGVHGGQPSAWGPRRDPVAVPHPVSPSPVPVSAAERLAQASAVEKISSGRWGTKPAVAASVPQPAADVEVIRAEEPTGMERRFTEGVRVTEEPTGMERRFTEGVRVTEEPRPRSYGDGARYGGGGGGGGPHVQQQAVEVPAAEVEGERPKLKLLPRTRVVEAGEARVSEEKQFYQPPVDPPRIENAHGMHVNMNMPRPGSAGTDPGSRAIERPRLNLKPRSLPVEELDKITERERKTVFGGARPRELVLKERGIDSPVATSPEVTSPATRAKNDVSKTELKSEPAAPTTRRGERSESFQSEQRNGRDLERKEYRPDLEKVERTSWRNDNRRNTRENEKAVERHQESETWRKPVVEQPKPEVPAPGLRHGKAASALELAQAFSRSVSDVKSDNHGPSQRSLPSRAQVPFSRLTDTRDFYSGPSQRQINGY